MGFMRSQFRVFLLFATTFTTEATAGGALKLDNYTFDKMLAIPDLTVLVKFDKSYAYGEKEDAFKTLSKQVYPVPKFFVGEVPVQEYGDKENDDLSQRFGLNKDDFPVYKLFKSGDKEGITYSGEVKADLLVTWLRQNGVKVPAIGTIDELDEIVKQFLKDGLKDEHISAAKKLADEEYKNDKKAPMYIKIMEKVKEKGEGYVETEMTRVSKIMQGKMAPEKIAEMTDKLKILSVFASKDEL